MRIAVEHPPTIIESLGRPVVMHDRERRAACVNSLIYHRDIRSTSDTAWWPR